MVWLHTKLQKLRLYENAVTINVQKNIPSLPSYKQNKLGIEIQRCYFYVLTWIQGGFFSAQMHPLLFVNLFTSFNQFKGISQDIYFAGVFISSVQCFVLFCFVLFCFVLFCFVLFCSVLFFTWNKWHLSKLSAFASNHGKVLPLRFCIFCTLQSQVFKLLEMFLIS